MSSSEPAPLATVSNGPSSRKVVGGRSETGLTTFPSSDVYVDSNLDWSFATLSPQMSKILADDANVHNRKKSHDFSNGLQIPRRLSDNIRRISNTNKALGIVRMRGSHAVDVDNSLTDIDSWSFNIFAATEALDYPIMFPVARQVFMTHGLLAKFNISNTVFEEFMLKVERHYRHNPFHNAVHGVDVMQTVHCIIVQSGFVRVMDDLEIFCILITALLHDIEHTGTNNNFHRNSMSEMAKLYVVSILENHHLRVALGLLRIFNLLGDLSPEQHAEFTDMMCSMILCTDMANHFDLLTNMKILAKAPAKCSSRIRIRRIMLLLLHAADISNSCKPWDVHKIWVSLLCQEFFEQGEREKSLDLPVSPCCDKLTVNIAALQIGFMHNFTRETFDVLYTLIEMDVTEAGGSFMSHYPWLQSLSDNQEQWNQNWSSLKYEFINELLTETASPRQIVIGGEPRQRKKWRTARNRWWCCCFKKPTNGSQMFNLAECSSNTV